jgi:hypothetical protein
MRADMVEAINGAVGHLQSMRAYPSSYVLERLPRVRELLDIAEREARDQAERNARDGAEQLLLPMEA